MFVRKLIGERPIWSISIYEGNDLLNLEKVNGIKNPVMTAKDVTDITADFVADPFIIKRDNSFSMFFEVSSKWDSKGRIGLALSEDGYKWNYSKIVLDEPFHLSYPYVFQYKEQYYMIPECGESGALKIYKANEFPFEWSFICDLMEGDFGDASLFQYDDKFWILAEKKTNEERNNNLHLYYSQNLFSGWKEHINSPIYSNDYERSRPAGRIIINNCKIFRFAQQDNPYYGYKIRVFEITNLSEDMYTERELELTFQGSNLQHAWNKDGMHHIDALVLNSNKVIAFLDGHYFQRYNKVTDKINKFAFRTIRKFILRKWIYKKK